MSILRYVKKMEAIDNLIKHKSTGNQLEFAQKLGISRALLNIYLNEMKELGFPICFSRTRNTYFYEENGQLVKSFFQKSDNKEDLSHYEGGTRIQREDEILLDLFEEIKEIERYSQIAIFNSGFQFEHG